MTEVNLKLASEGDLSVLLRFAREMAIERTGEDYRTEMLVSGIRTILGDRRLGEYWIAVCSDRPVGQILFTPEWNDWKNGWNLWVRRLFVAPEFRRSGIGEQLIAQVLKLVAAMGNVVEIKASADAGNVASERALGRLGIMPHGKFFLSELSLNTPRHHTSVEPLTGSEKSTCARS